MSVKSDKNYKSKETSQWWKVKSDKSRVRNHKFQVKSDKSQVTYQEGHVKNYISRVSTQESHFKSDMLRITCQEYWKFQRLLYYVNKIGLKLLFWRKSWLLKDRSSDLLKLFQILCFCWYKIDKYLRSDLHFLVSLHDCNLISDPTWYLA